MKLASYRINDTTTSGPLDERVGLVETNGVIDILDVVLGVAAGSSHQKSRAQALAERLTSQCYGPMIQLLHADDLQGLADVIEQARLDDRLALAYVGLDLVELLAPVPRPTSMRDAYAFRQHVEAARRNRGVEMIPEFDQFPVFYFTNHTAVSGPGNVAVRENHLNRLDFELECAIVIGREGRDIPASEADNYVAGYTIMNDWSARAMQMEEMKMSLGPAKGKDFATSIGPWLVTRDELVSRRIAGEHGERYDMTMVTRVNGTEVSRGNLSDMTWTFAQIIERASYGVTLHPGDVIGSGTVGTGCFLELNGSKITDNWWLKDGDVVECEVDGIGLLRNTIQLYRP